MINSLRIACWAAAVVMAGTRAPAAERPLNFVFFLIDDLGWTDAGCCGSDLYQTPHIDRLAAQGMRFTNGYAACTVCSPTRAAVLTGKYPARLHLTDWIAGHVRPYAPLRIPDWNQKLDHAETTIAEALAPAGYTSLHVGKWHLAPPNPAEAPKFFPTTQGFAVNIGGTQWGSPASYFWPYAGKAGDVDRSVRPLPPGGKEGEYLTDRLTDEALKLLQDHRDRPFFLYFPHYTVHTPLQAKAELIELYRGRIRAGLRHTNPTYAAMMHSLDESVGRVLAKLEDLKIAERTVVIFTGDNGGLIGNGVTNNAPLRAGKGTVYEGGTRVPLIVRWPGVTKAGSLCTTPVISVDFLPTILEMAGVAVPAGLRPDLDGVSFVSLLKDPAARLERDTLYWHYPHYHSEGATPYGAIRAGDLKLIEFYETGRLELYDLAADLGERQNLADRRPETAARLRARLDHWRQSVGAQMPTANPDHDPVKDAAPRRPAPKKSAQTRR